jgi:hypothetical protein
VICIEGGQPNDIAAVVFVYRDSSHVEAPHIRSLVEHSAIEQQCLVFTSEPVNRGPRPGKTRLLCRIISWPKFRAREGLQMEYVFYPTRVSILRRTWPLLIVAGLGAFALSVNAPHWLRWPIASACWLIAFAQIAISLVLHRRPIGFDHECIFVADGRGNLVEAVPWAEVYWTRIKTRVNSVLSTGK